MLLHWSVVEFNFAVWIFGVLLTTAFTSVLSLLSHNGHVNSFRWLYQGGPLEALSTLWSSRKVLQSRVWLATLFGLVIGMGFSVLDKALTKWIDVEVVGVNPTTVLVNTTQFISASGIHSLDEWNTYLRDFNATNAINNMFTSNTPPDKMYKPVMSSYDTVCDTMEFYAFNQSTQLTDGCIPVMFFTAGMLADNYTSSVEKNNGYYKVVLSGVLEDQYPLEIAAAVRSFYNNVSFGITDLSSEAMSERNTGLPSMPRTVSTKYVSDATVVVTVTTSRFFLAYADMLKSNVSDFVAGDVLIDEMEIPENNTFVANIRLYGTNMDAFICYGAYKALTCAYSTMTVAVTRSDMQPIGNSSMPWTSTMLTLQYIVTDTINVTDMRNANQQVSDTMSSLDKNFYADWDRSRLYILYTVYDKRTVFNVPSPVLWIVCVLAVVCLSLILFARCAMNYRYRGSMYLVVVKERYPKSLLVRTRFTPHLQFEDLDNPSERPLTDSSKSDIALNKI
ncbi:hypothetical protein EMPS_08220 [Entomortierella parvispora]|uniref:Transmembrane protein n=1 Tax=Entomortierella parvispora TaxID=205924 RepID=A0A9P3LZ77_9FUNG|nr:hypothetical protein EMPS_08220 [Entomortierella parvispora]